MASPSTTDYLALGLLAFGAAAGAVWWRRRGASGAPGIYTYHMASGAFDEAPSVPNVAVVVPPSFTGSSGLRVAVYFHGFTNCPENIIRDADGRCSQGGAVHHASHLAAQFVASGIDGILVVPGLRREQATGDAGRFARAGGFEAFLSELLGTHLAPVLGQHSIANIDRLTLMCHSGGYTATAAVLRGASPALAPKIEEVALLDALYGDSATFDAWIGGNPSTLRPTTDRRFVCVYTEGGGTAANARSLAERARSRLGAGTAVCWDDSTAAESPLAMSTCGAVFKRSPLDHTTVSRVWPQKVWSTGPLRA